MPVPADRRPRPRRIPGPQADPDNTGTWAGHPFGVEVSAYRTFDGVTIPSEGRAGWHFGTERWDDGVFFRYEITGYELVVRA